MAKFRYSNKIVDNEAKAFADEVLKAIAILTKKVKQIEQEIHGGGSQETYDAATMMLTIPNANIADETLVSNIIEPVID